MQDIIIEVDVLCDWQSEPPSYRLYIDNELFTERDYIWRNPNQWVREILVAELAPGTHTIKVEPVINQDPQFVHTFILANFSVNNKLQHLENGKFTV